jgi:uncharacterized RDD family membrane protein YckC
MQCPSCGAHYKKRTLKCPECGAFRNKNSAATSREPEFEQVAAITKAPSPKPRQKIQAKQTPSLIEFPGVSKSSRPQWRKELGERVREVQEKRAREATLEAGEVPAALGENGDRTTQPLELLPQTELPPLNPLVVAALQRIERANAQPNFSGNAAVATALDYERQFDFAEDGEGLGGTTSNDTDSLENGSSKPERVHNLAVVPDPAPKPETVEVPRKPTRLIRENDPALNYLDTVPTTVIGVRENRSAPLFYRLLSSIVDLIVVGILSLPLLALVQLTELAWVDFRVVAFLAGTVLLVGFLYLTISTAFTGRTLGMKLFSLRVVDARTGLIPTGRQSAGRAFVYLLSLASAGIALGYLFFNSEKHTAHDRFTRTAVIRV